MSKDFWPTKIHFNDQFHQKIGKGWARQPAIVVQHQKGRIIECNEVEILGDDGNVVARVVFRPEKVLNSEHYTIKAWVETYLDVKVT